MKNPNFIDGIRFEDDETGVVFDHFSFCEFIMRFTFNGQCL